MSIVYKPFELHCHTRHSDGTQTIEELVRAAAGYEFAGVALTDHNTQAAWQEVTPELVERYVPVVKGIEWTTFFGHMLVLGCDEYVDWRFALPDNIDDYIAQIVDVGGIAGIAHPFEIGAPICGGCHWEFNVRNWKNVSYIEIWSNEDPMTKAKNPAAIDWWTELLNEGHRLACSAGRDWHFPDGVHVDPSGKPRENVKPEILSATYLGVRGDLPVQEAVVDALRAGRTYVTLGPVLALTAEQNGRTFTIADVMENGACTVRVDVSTAERRHVWEQFGVEPQTVRIVGRAGTREMPLADGCAVFADLPVDGWLRAEVYGRKSGRDGQLLAVTSPVYAE